MLFSTVLGGVMSIWGQSMKARQMQNEMLMQRAEFNRSAVADARIEYYKKVVERKPETKKFLSGWTKRANSYKQ